MAIVDEARRAADEGRLIFAARLRSGPMGSVSDWAPIIEAVEAEGWTLAEWAVFEGSNGPTAYPLFRRRSN